MSATDELRRLLDERGVKWTRSCYSGMRYLENTKWSIVSSNPIKFTEYSDGQTKLIIDNATAEQAIAATLGSGTCRSTTPDDAWCFACSECGKSFPRNELHLANNHGEINYCPNCGAKVVSA